MLALAFDQIYLQVFQVELHPMDRPAHRQVVAVVATLRNLEAVAMAANFQFQQLAEIREMDSLET